MPPKIDLTGQQFGRLIVIREQKKRKNGIVWFCQCQCGRRVSVGGAELRTSQTRSCGCLKRELASQTARRTHTVHGDASRNPSRLYRIWHNMKKRCSNKNDKDYRNYGRRGIKVCKAWHDYRAFKKWALAHGYRENLQIDRIDNDGGYSPKNCRWVTQRENARNTSRTRWITINGKTESLVRWCEIYEVSYILVHRRLARGWDIVDALTRPVGIGQ